MRAMASTMSGIRAEGNRLMAGGESIRLRGVALGGWLNMENFITGFPANEASMRAAVRDVLGEAKYELFCERFMSSFFAEEDARFIADLGMNAVRIPVNYRHIEDDNRPFVIKDEGFAHLDRAIELCEKYGIYTIIDLHSLPGYQNQRWHCDNPTHVAMFWDHPHFQDRVVHLWEAIADRYRDNTAVAGYNPINEPGDQTRRHVGPFYSRIVRAIRKIDGDHTVFLDGNTYSTEFDIFEEAFDNVVYACHDYVPAGMGFGGPYPGVTLGEWIDKSSVEAKFVARSRFSRDTNTPIWVGEFGPIYTGETARDKERRQILRDQLDLYDRDEVSWSLWTYKDIGQQGIAYTADDSPYRLRFGDFVAKKARLSADSWGGDGEGPKEVTRPIQELVKTEFPGFDPYPWGRRDWVKTILLNIIFAQPLVGEYAELFRGASETDLVELAESFAFGNCQVREWLRSDLLFNLRGVSGSEVGSSEARIGPST